MSVLWHIRPTENVANLAGSVSDDASAWMMGALLRPLQFLLAFPSLLFLGMLGVMLFRPPDLELYWLDRIAFGLVVFVAMLRALLLRQDLRLPAPGWPMIALGALVLGDVVLRPFDSTTWSVVAAKFIVPYTLFYLAGLVFDDACSLAWLEKFVFAVLAYLSFTAIMSLAGVPELIFPRFILDESIGMHTDRARGPFLQAVANGVTLNLLGLLALDAYARGRLRGVWAVGLLAALPVAIVATRTRAVWLSFGVSLAVMFLRDSSRQLRRAVLSIAACGVVGLTTTLVLGNLGSTLEERLEERSPVEFRLAAYRAGCEMFRQRPFVGWGTNQMQTELARRIEGFQGEAPAVHNTYLEVLVEHGVLGFGLFLWVLLKLIRLRQNSGQSRSEGFAQSLQRVWPILLGVYLVNATFVVMNYQFVNGLLFAWAGIVARGSQFARHWEGYAIPI